MTPRTVAFMRYGGTPRSSIRVAALAASFVCSVESTRWPVSAAWIAISAVCRSRISPTMMMSGSCRISARTPSAKLRSIAACTCIWLNDGSIISIGSSIVQTFTSLVASVFSVEYSVVVLPEPVGPVTRMIPCGLPVISAQRALSSSEKPRSVKSLTRTSGSKIRITSFSPNAVGSVERRSSTSWPSAVRVLMRPSCGRRFSTTSMRPRILIRLVIAAMTGEGSW